MSEAIQIALISAGFASLVNCIFQLIERKLDVNKEEKAYAREQKEKYLLKKEEAYVFAIKRLVQVGVGFNYTRQDLINNKKLQEEVDECNNIFKEHAAQLRLYATDEIYNIYYSLYSWAKFSYADIHGPRLAENGNKRYSMIITNLSRLMQNDLGYRKYNSECEKIICPQCGEEHDAYITCKCGLKYGQMIERLMELAKMKQEENTIQ